MISAYLLKPGAQRLESCGAPRLAGDWPPAMSLELHEELEELLALAAVCVRCLERVLACRAW